MLTLDSSEIADFSCILASYDSFSDVLDFLKIEDRNFKLQCISILIPTLNIL